MSIFRAAVADANTVASVTLNTRLRIAEYAPHVASNCRGRVYTRTSNTIVLPIRTKRRGRIQKKRALSVRSACIVPRMQGMLEPIRRKRNHDVFKRNYVFKSRLLSRSGGCVSLSVHQREVGSNSTYTNNMMGVYQRI